MLLMLRVHPSRQSDLESPERIELDPSVRATEYRDGFGNLCTRVTAPPGRISISCNFLVRDSGEPDLLVPDAEQHALEDLPDHVLVFLLGSRYCDTDRLSETSLGRYSARRSQGGLVFKRSVITFTSGLSSDTSTRAPRERHGTDTTSVWASAGTSRILPSRFAVA